ncbi:YHS domain-containing (seleno)protein [Tenacibaculum sp. 47A_GOM-205m]|uniref:YHS domain-containing (seleno)protein n=1 Tax=Tenacibaculum sp. 47A_GOM-205m TaxID=1380384 RepID=UPI00048A91E7|nr:YHS domain-containing (seleno)protein [Tenacibaculum sp. 47A_GOM-205m]
MKNTITLLLLIISSTLFSQKTEYYLKKGYIAEGYDVVSYFNKKPLEGNKKYQTIYDGVKFKFSSEKNLALFKKNPTKYIPQYGGYCAYAIGKTGEKVSIDPKTFEIRDGKLYLFYNSWGTNTLKLWLKENPEQLKKQADINWKKRIHR